MVAKEMNRVVLSNGTEVRVFDVFGTRIVNATPHEITFREVDSDKDIVVPAGDIVINARPEETLVREQDGVKFVRTRFVADEETRELVDELVEKTKAVVVGSIIAAQAFPGKVFAMTPHPDFVRVPPAEKRVRPDKFTTFE